MWGGWNGGVVPENVSISNGTLKLEGHGNLYTGDVQGCNKNLPGGIRTGAAIATRDYYASGCYEVVAKVAPVLGACSAIWTFEYEEYDKDSEEYKNYPDQTGKLAIVNHEIDIELPTANADFDTPTFHAARFNTYEMENRSKSHFQTLPEAVDDGQWHTYRFDWHTGDANEQPRVDFYVDGQLLYTSYEHIPTPASRLWLGIWFPASKDSDGDGLGDTGWTGSPLTARRATRWEMKRIPRTAGPQIPSPRILRPNGMSISATEISPREQRIGLPTAVRRCPMGGVS